MSLLAAEFLAHGGHSHSSSGAPVMLIVFGIAALAAIIAGVWLLLRRRG